MEGGGHSYSCSVTKSTDTILGHWPIPPSHTPHHPPTHPTTIPSTLPSRTPHLQEASLPLVGRQPLQVMGEQGSLQVADGHVADVATWVTAHASHSLGGEEKEGEGRGG